MTEQEMRTLINALKAELNQPPRTQADARKLLQQRGFLTAKGELAPCYGGKQDAA